MKKILKKILPLKTQHFLYKLFFYKKIQINKLKERELEKEIAKNVFKDELVIRSGPFIGMKYTDTAFCSTILPKLVGSYEEPIQNWINEAIHKGYKKIIDIGSAEGYYSVGFAVKSPESIIYAYDIDNDALTENKKVAKLNGVENNIIFKNLCDHKELNGITEDNTLIICDIEGAEKELLDPTKSPSLVKADLIIESHDILRKGVSELLIKRFCKTHKIEIIIDYLRNSTSVLHYSNKNDIIKTLLNEKRGGVMRWIRMTKI